MNVFIQKNNKKPYKTKRKNKTKKPPEIETCNKCIACKSKDIFPLKDWFRERKKLNAMGMHVLFRSVTLKDNLTYEYHGLMKQKYDSYKE